jgi:hypothetical protein
MRLRHPSASVLPGRMSRHLDLVARSPETMVRRDATLTMIFLGRREFQQMLEFCPSIDAQSPCAWARAMEEG